ncbi:MAG TPA: class I SAM-dependent methyltransferase [Polyangiaceae bacterium]|jgi:ubiquinone/menaquinone biosynthesis C-methylase UbiE|nr:class I SAM-dependent methyltransferase [Polyangiaceae bacterium]
MTTILDCPPSQRSPATTTVVDLGAVKTRQQATWASGDFAIIGTTLQIVGESLCETADLAAGSRVLDVACGNGNATLAAARRFCNVTGLDYVPALLARAKERAAAERLTVDFVEGDAEALPFEGASFDVVLSTFGVMFAPDQRQAARELMRVVRPGGTIALANWTPEGFIGRLLATVGKHVPPPAGVASPIYWGMETRLAELFPGVTSLRMERRDFVFRYDSADHFVDVFRTFYGPTHKAFASLDSARQERLANDLRALIATFARSQRHAIAIPAEYVEVVIER